MLKKNVKKILIFLFVTIGILWLLPAAADSMKVTMEVGEQKELTGRRDHDYSESF
jgi:hypothetical protein